MIKIIPLVYIFFPVLSLAGDNPYSKYSSNYNPPTNNSISRYSSNYKPQSLFNQNTRSGYINRSNNFEITIYNDGSYKKSNRLNSSTDRIIEYNSLTNQHREGIKYKTKNGYILRYDDGSFEKLDKQGISISRLYQKDNNGNYRQGLKTGDITEYTDGYTKREFKFGSGYRTDETRRK